MWEVILEILKKTTLFLMIGKIVLCLGMGNAYEKYMRWVISFMIMVQLLNAGSSLLKSLSFSSVSVSGKNVYELWREETKNLEKQLNQQKKKINEEWKEKEQEIKEEEIDKIKIDQGNREKIKITIPPISIAGEKITIWKD